MPLTPRRAADVEVRLPADSAYIAVLRSIAAGVTARLDFVLDDIEDLRIAVGEAASMVLEQGRPGADLRLRVWIKGRTITAAIGAPSDRDTPISTESLGWQLLAALANRAEVTIKDGIFQVTLALTATPLGTSR